MRPRGAARLKSAQCWATSPRLTLFSRSSISFRHFRSTADASFARSWAITGTFRRPDSRSATVVSRVFAYLFLAAGLIEALVLRNIAGGLWLAFIGWYLNSSATASSQGVVMDHVLRSVDVGDVMDAPPPAVDPNTPVQSLVFEHILDSGHRAVPIDDSAGNLLGLVTLSDLRHLNQRDWPTTPVSGIMAPTDRLRTVTSADDLRSAIGLLADNRYHQLPVIVRPRLVGMFNRDHVRSTCRRDNGWQT